eukprot:m.85064 g.85064  ORF g.85064 m.85064 type:complete len:59 (+) comp12772_c1_seq1:115-291(+)
MVHIACRAASESGCVSFIQKDGFVFGLNTKTKQSKKAIKITPEPVAFPWQLASQPLGQ